MRVDCFSALLMQLGLLNISWFQFIMMFSDENKFVKNY